MPFRIPSDLPSHSALPWDGRAEVNSSAGADLAKVDPAEVDSAGADSVRWPRALLAECCLGEAECE